MAAGSASEGSSATGGAPMEERFPRSETGFPLFGPPRYESTEELEGRFGSFGGRYIPETLVAAHEELEKAYVEATKDPEFHRELQALARDYIGRPTPLYFAARLSEAVAKEAAAEWAKETGAEAPPALSEEARKAAEIWFKREEMAFSGAHKVNNAIGQAVLARRIGKKRIIAETGAGQHGVATATACALLGLDCTVYMGAEDMVRQELNVFRMRMLGATVIGVESGSRTLKDAINEAMRDWVTNVRTTHYIIGSAIGPRPFPTIVRDFQAIIGREARAQWTEQAGGLPSTVIAAVGGGSNAIGMFTGFLLDKDVALVGVEAGGRGERLGDHSATLTYGSPGVLHGTRTYLLQSDAGQVDPTHSISAGLDYPAVGPEHAHLKDSGRATYVSVDDKQALQALQFLSRTEGIIPALEPSHAVYHSISLAKARVKAVLSGTTAASPPARILVNLCGRGDKDMDQVARILKSAPTPTPSE